MQKQKAPLKWDESEVVWVEVKQPSGAGAAEEALGEVIRIDESLPRSHKLVVTLRAVSRWLWKVMNDAYGAEAGLASESPASPSAFMSALSNGVLLAQLGALIRPECVSHINVPSEEQKGKLYPNGDLTFFARENVTQFLKVCQTMKIQHVFTVEDVLVPTAGGVVLLVDGGCIERVVDCLHEVAEAASRELTLPAIHPSFWATGVTDDDIGTASSVLSI